MVRLTDEESNNGREKNLIVQRSIKSLKPSPENAHLYRSRTQSDSDFARLVDSIFEHGVQSPILVSADHYIISGHQRCKAAKEAALKTVPVVVLKLRRDKHTEDEWVAILREHNTGREKTFDELVRERLVDIDPDEAVQQIVDDRIDRTKARISTINVGTQIIKRHGISTEKRGMADAVLVVSRVLAWIRSGQLAAINVGDGTRRPRWRILPDALEAFERRRAAQPAAKATQRRKVDPTITQYF